MSSNATFDPDFHESDSEEGLAIAAALGQLIIEWNFAEHTFTSLIWEYVGGMERGATITNNLGNYTRADVLLRLATQFETEQEVMDRIEFAAQAFNILRENRNCLAHSHSIHRHSNGKLTWSRLSRKAPPMHKTTCAEFKDLIELKDEMVRLGKLALAIFIYQHCRKERQKLPELPDKFPLPRKLLQIDIEDLERPYWG